MITFYPNSIYYPKEAVEEKYQKGELATTERRVLDFAERHKNRIWVISREDSDNPSDEVLLDNLRAYLLLRGTLQPAAEMAELIREINKDIWYRNEHQKESAEEVTSEWEKQYSDKWREARMFEAFVLIDKLRDKIIKILRAGMPTTPNT